MAEFRFDLGLSLKRSAIIIIAQNLWKSQDVKIKINELIEQKKLKLPINKFRFLDFTRLARNLSDDHYCCWEEVISYVLKKTDSLMLPTGVKEDLKEIIILLGEKIFYFYDEFREGDEVNTCFWEYVRCCKCAEAAKTEHFYSFSNNGTAIYKCSALHFKNVPVKDSEKFKKFIDDAIWHSNIEIIKKYQNDIIVYLEFLQPGLNLKLKKDIIFNIICVWIFIQPKLKWKRIFVPEYNPNGYVKIPEHYLKNKDFIIPLEILPQMIVGSCPPTFRYLATKLHEYEDKPLLFSKMVKMQINYELAVKINKRLHFYPNPDYKPDRLLMILKLMSEKEISNFVQENLKYLLLYFLPVWPFREMVPHILDVCIKRKFDLNNFFFLDIISICIGNQNRKQHKVRNQIYLQAFQKIWHRTSKETKLTFLVRKTKFLLMENKDCDIVKKILFNNECVSEKESVIVRKWIEIFEKENFVLVNKFLSEVVFNAKLLTSELECFLCIYDEEQYDGMLSCAEDFLV